MTLYVRDPRGAILGRLPAPPKRYRTQTFFIRDSVPLKTVTLEVGTYCDGRAYSDAYIAGAYSAKFIDSLYMTTNPNEHIIAKHGDYVRRISRNDTIVTQYIDTHGGPWLDSVVTNADNFDGSRLYAKRLQINQERKLDTDEVPYTCHACKTCISLVQTRLERGYAWHPQCLKEASK